MYRTLASDSWQFHSGIASLAPPGIHCHIRVTRAVYAMSRVLQGCQRRKTIMRRATTRISATPMTTSLVL